MKRNLLLVALVATIFPLISACGTSAESGQSENSGNEVTATVAAQSSSATTSEAAPSKSGTFENGTLIVPDTLTIKVTDYRIIPAGAEGNQYGDSPVLAVWYDTTNTGNGERTVTPMTFIWYFEAYQDNDPNRMNRLDVGSSPDLALVDFQSDEIKPGGTVSGATAYRLSDSTTPVELVASTITGEELGRMKINLS